MNNEDRLDSLEGPLHTSLQNHFLRYYTLQEKDNKEDNKTLAARRFGYLARLTDEQEES